MQTGLSLLSTSLFPNLQSNLHIFMILPFLWVHQHRCLISQDPSQTYMNNVIKFSEMIEISNTKIQWKWKLLVCWLKDQHRTTYPTCHWHVGQMLKKWTREQKTFFQACIFIFREFAVLVLWRGARKCIQKFKTAFFAHTFYIQKCNVTQSQSCKNCWKFWGCWWNWPTFTNIHQHFTNMSETFPAKRKRLTYLIS